MERSRSGREHDGADFDFSGLGGLGQGLAGLFRGIEGLVELASKLEQTGSVSGGGEVNFDHLREGMKGVYGFTVRTAGGGPAKVETFGNIRKSPSGPKVEDEREPITDVFDEEGRVVVIMEMPGIGEEDIVLDLSGDILEVSTKGGGSRYRKEVLLPVSGEGRGLRRRYSNGILEVTIDK